MICNGYVTANAVRDWGCGFSTNTSPLRGENLLFLLMQVDVLIIGQGICGTFLSWELEKANQSFIVIDDAKPFTASKVASGVINPVTGRRIVKTWMIDELLPFTWDAYNKIGSALNINCISQKNIIDFFSTPQMKLAFEERFKKDEEYLSKPTNENDWQHLINYDFGYGIIDPVYLVDIAQLLIKQREHLKNNNQLIEEHFKINDLKITNDITYQNITANKIIFCDGANGFNNPYFKNLPYGANKGEALLVEINNLPKENIIKKGHSLVPWKENIFWLGST